MFRKTVISEMLLCFDPQGHRSQDIIFCEIIVDNVVIIIIITTVVVVFVVSTSIDIIMIQTVATHRPVDAQKDLYFGSSGRKSPAVLWRSDGGGSRQ